MRKLRVVAALAILVARGAAVAGPGMRLLENKPFNEIYSAETASFAVRPELTRFDAVAELPKDKWYTLDIRALCNFGFADKTGDDQKGGWIDYGPTFDLHYIKTGRRQFYGVPFDVIDPASNKGKSIIAMKSKRMSNDSFPEQVIVPVGRKAKAIYFLHGCGWATFGDGISYTVVFADGRKEVIPVIPAGNMKNQGENIQDWISMEVVYGADARYVPVPMPGTTNLRFIYALQWRNRKNPQGIIKHIEFKTGRNVITNLLILGITCNEG